MNTRKLSQNPHVPAKASANVANMKGGSRNDTLIRDKVPSRATLDIAETAKQARKAAAAKGKPVSGTPFTGKKSADLGRIDD